MFEVSLLCQPQHALSGVSIWLVALWGMAIVLWWYIFKTQRRLHYLLFCLSLGTGLAGMALTGLHLFKRSPLLLPKPKQAFVCPTPYQVMMPELLQAPPQLWQAPLANIEEILQEQPQYASAYKSWQQLLHHNEFKPNSVRSLNDGQPYNLLWSKHTLAVWEAYGKAKNETEKQVARMSIAMGLPQISFPLISTDLPAEVALKLWLHLGQSGWREHALYLSYLGDVFQAGGLTPQARQAWLAAQNRLQTEANPALDASVKADLQRILQRSLDMLPDQQTPVMATILTDRYRFSERLPGWALGLWLLGSLLGTSGLIYWLGLHAKPRGPELPNG